MPRYLVIGGHARGVGKTALVVDIIRAFPEASWTVVKVSPHGHKGRSGKSSTGKARAAAPRIVLQEEKERAGRSGSSRVLAAGARRSFWLRTPEGSIVEGTRKLRPKLQGSEYVVFESNAVLEVVGPHLYLMVLDPAKGDFKESAQRNLERVDAFVTRGPLAGARWKGVSNRLLESRPVFQQRPGEPVPEGLLVLIRNSLFRAVHPPTT